MLNRWIFLFLLISSVGFAQNFEDSALEDEFNEVEVPELEETVETTEMPLEAPYISPEEESKNAELVPYASDPITVAEPETKPVRQKSPGPTRKKSRYERIESHPMAAKGLIRINKDGSYIYKTPTGEKSRSFSFRVGQQEAPRIVAADNVTDFQDIYGDTTVIAFGFEYEYQATTRFGKWGLVLGSGLFTANGRGRFLNGDVARESYTFLGVPLTAGGIYRFEFSDRQWLAPFATVGGAYYGLAEIRDDGKAPNVTGTPAVYGGGGILFSITNWDRETAFTLWNEYGIANMWLNLDYRLTQSLSEDVDVSSNSLNLGLTFDF